VDEMRDGLCKVQICKLEFTQVPTKLHLLVIPLIESVKNDFDVLKSQMESYYSKIFNQRIFHNAPTTYPHIVAVCGSENNGE